MRNHVIKVRCTADEKGKLQALSEKVNLKVTEYVRAAALNQHFPPALSPEEREHLFMLAKYRSNFQRISNLIKSWSPELAREIEEVKDELSEWSRKYSKL